MNYKKLITAIATASLLLSTASTVLAQDASPSDSPSPSPEASPSPSDSPSPEATSAGGTTKQNVLGETTTLGSTGQEKDIAKWVIAISLAIVLFIVGIRTASNSAQD